MDIASGQQDMRAGYHNGATGMLVSGLVWLAATCSALLISVQVSAMVLFFGGMLIFPLSVVLARAFGCPGKHTPENPLSSLAVESTVVLFVGLLIAFVMLFSQPWLFYPVMLLTIGVRYLLFQTLYGLKIYWLVGIVLMAGGAAGMFIRLPAYLTAGYGAAVELIFALVLLTSVPRSTKPATLPKSE